MHSEKTMQQMDEAEARHDEISGKFRPSRQQAQEAVRILLAYAGDDPMREGLLETPARVVKAFDEWFSGYAINPAELLGKTFGETSNYDEMVILRRIPFHSYCEHHMAAIIGYADVGYLPKARVVGISKLARVVHAFAARLQIQEKMTADIAQCIHDTLGARGTGVIITASHQCMTTRGVHVHGTDMVTSTLLGEFRTQPAMRNEFLTLVDKKV